MATCGELLNIPQLLHGADTTSSYLNRGAKAGETIRFGAIYGAMVIELTAPKDVDKTTGSVMMENEHRRMKKK
jgi:hypothetical protein